MHWIGGRWVNGAGLTCQNHLKKKRNELRTDGSGEAQCSEIVWAPEQNG